MVEPRIRLIGSEQSASGSGEEALRTVALNRGRNILPRLLRCASFAAILSRGQLPRRAEVFSLLHAFAPLASFRIRTVADAPLFGDLQKSLVVAQVVDMYKFL